MRTDERCRYLMSLAEVEAKCKGPGPSVSRSQPMLAFNRSHTTLPTLLGQDVMKSTETTDKPGHKSTMPKEASASPLCPAPFRKQGRTKP